MPRIVVINGEPGWADRLPGHEVVQRQIQTCGWVLRDGGLYVVDREGGVRVDGVLWRVGAIRNHPRQLAALNLIRLAGVPCVNRAGALARCHDRLTMLAELRECGIPVVPFDAAVGDGLLARLGGGWPRVVKVGSHHGGWGKTRVTDPAAWPELADLLYAADDYATVEPYVPHTRDVRCLLVGDHVYAMARRGAGWRANVDTREHRLVDPPPALEDYTRRFAAHLGADVLALDALEQEDGRLVVLESNETPGLSGFPEGAWLTLAGLLTARMS